MNPLKKLQLQGAQLEAPRAPLVRASGRHTLIMPPVRFICHWQRGLGPLTEAYSLYAARSAEGGQRRRWIFAEDEKWK